MSRSFIEQNQYIAVAVKFDAHTLPLVQAAAGLCTTMGKKLCLLHVVEPWAELSHAEPFGGNDPLWNVTQAVERNTQDLAMGRLTELESMLPPEVGVRKLVVTGKPVEALLREAQEVGACFLIVGANYNTMKYMPAGLSTALSLMVASPVPVLVVDTTQKYRLPASGLRLLLADDLADHSEAAIDFGFELATALGHSELHHVHVNGLTYDSLKSGLNTAAAASHTPVNAVGAAEDVYRALLANLEERLTARASGQREYFEAAGGRYAQEVATGNVAEEVYRVATAAGSDAVVFGRHKTFYTKPFYIGRVPFRSMLALRKPIFIVPERS